MIGDADEVLKLRRVFVLRQVEIPWQELRAGDVFRTDAIDAEDIAADPDTWYVAQQVAVPDDAFSGNWRVACLEAKLVGDGGESFKLMPPKV